MTAELNHADFASFFAALWGEQARPFAWQSVLAERVLDASHDPAAISARGPATTGTHGSRPWPDAIALPTRAGKTACLDIAVFSLAAQAPRFGSGRAMTAPRRIFFVVDRRIIVDEAHDRAGRLARKLEAAEGGILQTVADRLRRLARGGGTGLGDERPLAVHSLRGGRTSRAQSCSHPNRRQGSTPSTPRRNRAMPPRPGGSWMRWSKTRALSPSARSLTAQPTVGPCSSAHMPMSATDSMPSRQC